MSTVAQVINDPDFAKLSQSDQQGVLSQFDPGFAKISPAEFPHVVQSIVQPPMPKAPIPAELQPDTGSPGIGKTYLQNFVDKLQGMAQVAQDVGRAAETGDWAGLQKKYPPMEAQPTAQGLAKTAGEGYKSAAQSVGVWPEIRKDPRTGEIDPWATVGATLSNQTMALIPLAAEIRGINAEFPTPAKPAPTAAEEAATAAAKTTLKQKAAQLALVALEPKKAAVNVIKDYLKTTAEGEPTPAATPTPAPTPTPPGVPRGIIIPEYGGAVPADIYRQISKLYPDLTDTQIRGLANEVGQAAGVTMPARRPAPTSAEPPETATAPPEEAPVPTPTAAPAAAQPTAAPSTLTEQLRQSVEQTPEAAPAEAAPPTASTPQAAPTRPLKRSEYPTRDEVAQQLPGATFRSFKDLQRVVGPEEAQNIVDRHYSALDRLRQDYEKTIPQTDQAALRARGIDPTGMTTQQVHEALGRTAPLRKARKAQSTTQ